MNPAFSVIFLTTLIGAAQGLFLALVTGQTLALFGLVTAQSSRGFLAAGAMVALLLSVLGLLASFLHLGRPERAWRSAAMWRTSWLSREVIVLPAFMAAVSLYALAHFAGWTPALATLQDGTVVDATLLLGLVGAALALALFVCTAMIYACLPFLREWHSPLTVVNYFLLGSASGFTLAAALALMLAPGAARLFTAWALMLTMLGLVSRATSLVRNARLRPKSTLQTAIGIKHPRIVQKSMGFMGGSFNTREFFHGQSRAALRSIKWIFLAGAFAIPALLLTVALWLDWTRGLPLAFVIQFLGLIAERWFFFAEANHPQNLYYQAIA